MKKILSLVILLSAFFSMSAQPKDEDTKYATELLKPGTDVPDIKLKDINGKKFQLSKLRGHYVVLDFWASWCPDCRKDIPNLLRIYNIFHEKGIEFIGISFDTDAEAWRKAVEKYALPYRQVSELKRMKESSIAQSYGVHWIPSMYIIDPEGKVVMGTVLSDKLERKLYELTDPKYQPTIERLSIDGAKGKLSAIIQKPILKQGEKCPMVMLFHGFTGNKDAKLLTLLADSLQQNGIASIRFDFNGHGESEGPFEEMTVPNEVEDAKQVFEYVRDLNYVSSIAVAGHSQGGVVASLLAGELNNGDLQAIVLLAPAGVIPDDAIRGLSPDGRMMWDMNPLDPPQYVEFGRGLKLGLDYIKTAQRLKIYKTASHYNGPAFIIHGTGDRVVPFTYGERFHEIWPESEWLLLDGFDHGFSQNMYRVSDDAKAFLLKILK